MLYVALQMFITCHLLLIRYGESCQGDHDLTLVTFLRERLSLKAIATIVNHLAERFKSLRDSSHWYSHVRLRYELITIDHKYMLPLCTSEQLYFPHFTRGCQTMRTTFQGKVSTSPSVIELRVNPSSFILFMRVLVFALTTATCWWYLLWLCRWYIEWCGVKLLSTVRPAI